MTPYIEPPDIPEGWTIQRYRAARVEPMRPRRGILRRTTRRAVQSARHAPTPNPRRTAA